MSDHLISYELADGMHAVWNGYFPKVTTIDSKTFGRLQELPKGGLDWPLPLLRRLRRARLIYRGDSDPYTAEFFRSADRALERADAEAQKFYAQRRPYDSLHLVNSGCNLGCSYCVSYYGDDFRRSGAQKADRGSTREAAVLDVVDQYMSRKREFGQHEARINMNGGEILLRWPLIETILRHISRNYPEFSLSISMNTNATLLTEEIAAVLAKYGAEVHVSVDGYKEAHDATRHYHTGGGSFDRVMAGIENYRRANQDPQNLIGFQGTIEDIDSFDATKLFEMRALGFSRARLAPNLLKKNAAHGKKAAWWEATLALKSQNESLTFGNSHFERLLTLMDTVKGFRPHCGGLTGLATRAIILNVDSMQLSHLCSFSSPASMAVADVRYDIYNPALWNVSRQYIADRINMLRTACAGCDVLGACQGSCVYNGLDLANKINPAGCGYQRALFRHAIDFRHSGEIRPLPINPEDSGVEAPENSHRCGSHTAAPASTPDGSRKVWKLAQVC
jgi:radical SAM protein with 4Fe4S-binding SPASM domain